MNPNTIIPWMKNSKAITKQFWVANSGQGPQTWKCACVYRLCRLSCGEIGPDRFGKSGIQGSPPRGMLRGPNAAGRKRETTIPGNRNEHRQHRHAYMMIGHIYIYIYIYIYISMAPGQYVPGRAKSGPCQAIPCRAVPSPQRAISFRTMLCQSVPCANHSVSCRASPCHAHFFPDRSVPVRATPFRSVPCRAIAILSSFAGVRCARVRVRACVCAQLSPVRQSPI